MVFSSILWSHGAMGQSTAVNTSIQTDPHFIGWYMGPSTSKYILRLTYKALRIGLS
jgi:hypothetical protein